MTPDEILGDLRDVILPGVASGEMGLALSPWPLVFVALVILLWATLARWRATAWRREARAALEEADAIASRPARVAALVQLFRRVARHAPPGNSLPTPLLRPATVATEADLADLHARISEMLK